MQRVKRGMEIGRQRWLGAHTANAMHTLGSLLRMGTWRKHHGDAEPWPNRGTPQNEILTQDPSSQIDLPQDGGFKAAMLECTKGSKSLSPDDTSGVLKELKTK